MMERIALAPELEFSRIAYGFWRLGDDLDRSEAHVRAKIKACLDQGITTFDQADIYGGYTSEAILGQALRSDPGLRAQMEIVTKCGIVAPEGRHRSAKGKSYNTSGTHILASVDASLRDMGIDHIDLLLIHRPDPFMDHIETGAVLDELVASGKVRHVGVSNFRPRDWELLQSGLRTPLVTNQIEISLAEPRSLTNGDLAFHQRHGHRVMAWSPLGGGKLMTERSAPGVLGDEIAAACGVDRAAVALAFLLAHPAGIVPVAGTNSLDRIARLSDAMKVQLDREDWFRLYTAALGQEVP